MCLYIYKNKKQSKTPSDDRPGDTFQAARLAEGKHTLPVEIRVLMADFNSVKKESGLVTATGESLCSSQDGDGGDGGALDINFKQEGLEQQ